jgi:hypothetical protein
MKTYAVQTNPPIQGRRRLTPKELLLVVCILWSLFACIQTAQATNVYTLQVPSIDPWLDTGIVIPNNSLLSITAAGIVSYGYSAGQSADANGGDSGVDFYSAALLPTTEICSLIGKIGGTTGAGTGTLLPTGLSGKGPGFVGISYDQIVTDGGELFLGYNDIPYFIDGNGYYNYVDNTGSFSVTVSFTPVPEPSTSGLIIIGGLATCYYSRKKRKS